MRPITLANTTFGGDFSENVTGEQMEAEATRPVPPNSQRLGRDGV